MRGRHLYTSKKRQRNGPMGGIGILKFSFEITSVGSSPGAPSTGRVPVSLPFLLGLPLPCSPCLCLPPPSLSLPSCPRHPPGPVGQPLTCSPKHKGLPGQQPHEAHILHGQLLTCVRGHWAGSGGFSFPSKAGSAVESPEAGV